MIQLSLQLLSILHDLLLKGVSASAVGLLLHITQMGEVIINGLICHDMYMKCFLIFLGQYRYVNYILNPITAVFILVVIFSSIENLIPKLSTNFSNAKNFY